MGDKRFDDRLKRIESRQKTGPTAELIAGVGDVRSAQEEAKPKKSASIILIAIGSVIGFAVFMVLRDLVGLDTIAALTPDTALYVAQSHPLIFIAAGLVPIMAFMLLLSFFRGRRAAKMMSLTGGFVGALMGGVYAAL